MNKELRYEISDWHQLSKCLSNNTTKTHIEVSDIVNNCVLTGIKISLIHEDFGALFTCVLNAKGNMISETAPNIVYQLDAQTILDELYKYGYVITYKAGKSISTKQLNYLMTLRKLHFDKLRILSVYDVDRFGHNIHTQYIVAFNSNKNKYWLNNAYSCSRNEFIESIYNGSACNISGISKKENYDWSWLYNFVANIDDVLSDNG